MVARGARHRSSSKADRRQPAISLLQQRSGPGRHNSRLRQRLPPTPVRETVAAAHQDICQPEIPSITPFPLGLAAKSYERLPRCGGTRELSPVEEAVLSDERVQAQHEVETR